jgi:hypothetical protein
LYRVIKTKSDNHYFSAQKSATGFVDTDIIDIIKIMKTSYAFSLAVIINIVAGSGSSRDVEDQYITKRKRAAVTVTVRGSAIVSGNKRNDLYQCQEEHYAHSDQDMIPDS